jgi:predicted nucleic acid-binding protein
MTLGASVRIREPARRPDLPVRHVDLGVHKTSVDRLPFQDALIAATAARQNVGVLHYDGHFDTLSKVLDFESRWATPPGSLEPPSH